MGVSNCCSEETRSCCRLPASITNMPGNIKKTSGPDPDPSPWLEVKDHMKEKSKAKPYDPKKQVWVPNANKEEGGYFEGICAEEIAALNLAKFRKAQQELEEVEERAK